MKSPFKFLDSYILADRDIFFGRDQGIAQSSGRRAEGIANNEGESGRKGEEEKRRRGEEENG